MFVLASAPAIWQRSIEQVLQDIPMTQCFLDDIIITGRTKSDHFNNLKMVERLNNYSLKVNEEKSLIKKVFINQIKKLKQLQNLTL